MPFTAATPSTRPARSILLVEDEPLIAMMLVDYLEELQYPVIAVATAAEALAKLQGDPDIGLLMTDVSLKGMSGLELASAARALRPDLPILFSTGHTHFRWDRTVLGDRGIDLIIKPMSLSELERKIGVLLKQA